MGHIDPRITDWLTKPSQVPWTVNQPISEVVYIRCRCRGLPLLPMQQSEMAHINFHSWVFVSKNAVNKIFKLWPKTGVGDTAVRQWHRLGIQFFLLSHFPRISSKLSFGDVNLSVCFVWNSARLIWFFLFWLFHRRLRRYQKMFSKAFATRQNFQNKSTASALMSGDVLAIETYVTFM